jgi:hypothetical protein
VSRLLKLEACLRAALGLNQEREDKGIVSVSHGCSNLKPHHEPEKQNGPIPTGRTLGLREYARAFALEASTTRRLRTHGSLGTTVT